MFAARLWFLARWIGHDAVAVLDGGFTRGQAAGLSRYAESDRRARASVTCTCACSPTARRRRLRAHAPE